MVLAISRTKRLNSYSYVPKGFRAFLDKELREHNDYDKEKQANINTPGLVVMYNASKELNNPTWVLSTKDELAPYLNFIKNHRPMESSAIEMQVQNGGYDLLSSYIIYMNIPFAPARFITVQYDEAVRMTKVTPVQATLCGRFFLLHSLYESRARRSYLRTNGRDAASCPPE